MISSFTAALPSQLNAILVSRTTDAMDQPRTEWWLMSSSLPDLNWARLRIHASGACEIFDCDGATHRFQTEDDAVFWLTEDEFTRLTTLSNEDEPDMPYLASQVSPPVADSDETLLPLMFQTWSATANTWFPRTAG